MSVRIAIQIACDNPIPISKKQLTDWAKLALKDHRDHAELTLRFVNEDEIRQLNRSYRKQDKPTNVLAFPYTLPHDTHATCPLIGDVIICPTVLEKESLLLQKTLTEHWAHIVLHGVLHVLGYDHIDDDDAARMQAVEIALLKQLGFDNPYTIEDNDLE